MTAPEQLPEYHDEPRVDPETLRAWLVRRHRARWGDASVSGIRNVPSDAFQAMAAYERQIIHDVLTALQATGDATLVKNATYRALLRDRADLERLAAHLLNGPHAAAVLEADGDPVAAAIQLLSRGAA